MIFAGIVYLLIALGGVSILSHEQAKCERKGMEYYLAEGCKARSMESPELRR